MNDPLRERLAGDDPLRHRDGDHTYPAAPPPELLERIMSTPVLTPTPGSAGPAAPSRRRPKWAFALGGAAAAALVAVGAFAVLRDDSSPAPAATAPLVLQLGDDSMASCIQFSVDILAQFPIAFEGTVTDVTDDQVTLTVDRWYRGGDASTVQLLSSPNSVALIGGADFRTGGQYLVSASDGAVSVCGYTGEATPELRAAFDQAFGG